MKAGADEGEVRADEGEVRADSGEGAQKRDRQGVRFGSLSLAKLARLSGVRNSAGAQGEDKGPRFSLIAFLGPQHSRSAVVRKFGIGANHEPG